MYKNAHLPDSIDLLLAQILIKGNRALGTQINMHHRTLACGQEEALPISVPVIHLHTLDPTIPPMVCTIT